MKKLLFLIITAFVTAGAYAQSGGNDEITMIQSVWGMEKRQIVEAYMNIPEAQKAAFWNVYNQYEADRKKLGQERIMLISDYVNNYTNLTDEKADELAQKILKNNVAYEKLQQKYYKKVKKVTSPLKAAQFVQLELYIQGALRSYMQETLPFIGELDSKHKKK